MKPYPTFSLHSKNIAQYSELLGRQAAESSKSSSEAFWPHAVGSNSHCTLWMFNVNTRKHPRHQWEKEIVELPGLVFLGVHEDLKKVSKRPKKWSSGPVVGSPRPGHESVYLCCLYVISPFLILNNIYILTDKIANLQTIPHSEL